MTTPEITLPPLPDYDVGANDIVPHGKGQLEEWCRLAMASLQDRIRDLEYDNKLLKEIYSAGNRAIARAEKAEERIRELEAANAVEPSLLQCPKCATRVVHWPDEEMRQRAEKAEAELAALRAGDMVLVPKEPTQKMISAGDTQMPDVAWDTRDSLRDAWACMLAAAPVADGKAQEPVKLRVIDATAPREIYLNVSDEPDDAAEPWNDSWDNETTWCQDPALSVNVKYIRADLAATTVPEIAKEPMDEQLALIPRPPEVTPLPLVRYARTGPGANVLFKPAPDGYWTPWHVAQAHLDATDTRAKALEEAAKICDGLIAAEYATGKVDHNETAWSHCCGAAIRAAITGNPATTDADKRDAERYRWLREDDGRGTASNRVKFVSWKSGDALDAAIDAAITEKP
jgi:hypothetical protein